MTSANLEVVQNRTNIDTLSSRCRADFPILEQCAADGRPLIYLDHAATSQKPRPVLEAMQHYYACDNANVHRGAHQLSVRSTESFEAARSAAAEFVGAASAREIVFTRNASEAINLVARSWGDANLREEMRCCSPSWSTTATWCQAVAGPRTGCVLRHVGITKPVN